MPSRPPAPAPIPGLPQLKFTTFAPVGFLNGKNVSSSFAKADSQSWYARRPSEQERDALHDAKRRRLVGDEGDAQPTASVLTAAPEGAVRPPRAKPAIEKDAETAAADPLSHTLVIHPGSRWLRIGLASSLAPVAVPNVIARKVRGTVPGMNTSKGKERATDTSTSAAGSAPAASALAGAALPPLPAAANGDTAMAEAADDDDDEGWDSSSSSSSRKRRPAGVDAPGASATDPLSAKIQSIRGDLRARMRAYKLRGQGNGNSQAATYNATVVPQAMEEDFEGDIEWTTAEDEVHVGNKAVRIPDADAAGYDLRWPFQRGGFNTAPYSTPQELLGDVQAIYTGVLRDELDIAVEEFKDYGVILLIPDLYDDVYVREMTDLLVRTMGFKQICLIQESVGATFGAGYSSACVIDIGSRTSTITCVEEGLVLPETRMVLDFGGDDITHFLMTLLHRLSFPYKEVDLAKWYDWVVVEELKERLVVLSEGDIGLNLYDFYVRHPGALTQKYSMRVYDDCILAPYALFAPRVIDFEAKRTAKVDLWSKDVDDNVDIGATDVTNAMRNSVRHLLVPPPPAVAPAPGAGGSGTGTPAVEEQPVVAPSTGALPALPPAAAPAPSSFAGSPAPETGSGTPKPPAAPLASGGAGAGASPASPSVDIAFESSKLPLDVAVVESLMAAGPAEERLKKVAANLLIVGGTGGIHNVGFAVQSRVAPALAVRAPFVKECAYVPCPKEIEPENLAWKGVGALGRLEGAQEMWIRSDEWEALGMRAVRERAFYWA
ncbi:nucleus protein [Rhodotorula diobovata]|uniref:Nucleus protein n=1 Tax=Rhodotorula diobovata TaxID=5288 RepID=A0A5C5G7M0_9BASI|nr:nucleus protein [Rhodotorula diobovata]